jgi:hypothetical protein
MRLPRVRTFLPMLLAAFAAAGCDSATMSVPDLSGTYVLETRNGNALPAPVLDAGTYRHFLLADTMRLEPDNTGTQVRVHRVEYDDPTRPDVVQASTSRVWYRFRLGRVELGTVCPPNANCFDAPQPVASREGDVLTVSYAAEVLRYRRTAD